MAFEQSAATSDAWSRFAVASDARDFCTAWLTIQCQSVQGAAAALVLWELSEGSYAPAAIWPDPRRDITYLGVPARGQWLQSFKEFPPRMKPGSFSLDRVMESVTAHGKGSN